MGKGKNKKHGDNLGKALMKGHKRNQNLTRSNRNGLENLESEAIASLGFSSVANNSRSVTEVNELEAFLADAVLAGRKFESYRSSKVINMDSSDDEEEQQIEQVTEDQNVTFDFKNLPVPRRPSWTRDMSATDLAQREIASFMRWRKHIAELQSENKSLHVTPFEKNIEYWRQLWRVVEKCHILVQVVDARNPLLFRTPDIDMFTKETGAYKSSVLLVNKADFLTEEEREEWAKYFVENNISFLYFSAKEEQEKLDHGTPGSSQALETTKRLNSSSLVSRYELLHILGKHAAEAHLESLKAKTFSFTDLPATIQTKIQTFVEQGHFSMDWFISKYLEAFLRISEKGLTQIFLRYYNSEDEDRQNAFKTAVESIAPPPPSQERPTVGMVGYPNVGKSSVINVLCGVTRNDHTATRVSVAATPGHTKHFQTIVLSEQLMLCDCPGLVFPTFMNSKADLICNGILPIDEIRGRDFYPAVEILCRCIAKDTLCYTYGLRFPLPESSKFVKADMLLEVFCQKRSYMGSGHDRYNEAYGARVLLKDFVSGKLCYCCKPPNAELAVKSSSQDSMEATMALAADDLYLTDAINEEEFLMTELLAADQEVKDKRKYGKKGKKNRCKNPYSDNNNMSALSADNKPFTRVVRPWDQV